MFGMALRRFSVFSEKATSSAVSGEPSWKRALGRRKKRSDLPSSEISTSRATCA